MFSKTKARYDTFNALFKQHKSTGFLVGPNKWKCNNLPCFDEHIFTVQMSDYVPSTPDRRIHDISNLSPGTSHGQIRDAAETKQIFFAAEKEKYV